MWVFLMKKDRSLSGPTNRKAIKPERKKAEKASKQKNTRKVAKYYIQPDKTLPLSHLKTLKKTFGQIFF